MRAVPIIAFLLLASCYRPSVDPCRVTCASDEECPSGTACGTGNRCHPAGEPTACATVDDDGGIDATPDAPDGGPPAGAFKSLAVGRAFACAVTSDAMRVTCWGDNSSGQLGDNTLVDHDTASPIDEAGPWKEVAAGAYHACAIKENGELFCWGDASYGQIDGTQANQTRPDPVRTLHPTGLAWLTVDGGTYHTCAIDADTVMWCWGQNNEGQLGTAAGPGVKTIAAIPSHSGWASLSADGLRTCAVKNGGAGWCWGYGALGQTSASNMAHLQSSDVPVQIVGGQSWRSLSSGRGHTCGVTTGNALLCFGEMQIGELGVATSSGAPVTAQPGADYNVVFAGPLTTCATRTGPDRLICFGDNRAGQLGSGDRELANQPFTLGMIGRVVAGGGGLDFACALEESGTVKCWGRDDEGRCGDGTADDHFIGPPVLGLTGTIDRLTSFADHTCALTDDGRVFCWGHNSRGQLGVGDRVDRATAVEVSRPGGMAWTDVSAGLAHTCGVAGGNLYCWGSDDDGQLGNGAGGTTTTPMEIGIGTTWASVSAGWAHGCAVDSNGERWCWGNNVRSALGAGSGAMAIETSPVMTSNGPAGWLRLVMGASYGCGISSDASPQLWCWGDNDQQELGTATPASTNTPLRVLDPSMNWQQIATDALYGTVCGIRAPDGSGGDLWCWGYNSAGQAGTGNVTTPAPPTEVGTARNWLRIDLGLDFACGISAALELRCWGYNDSKQVSDEDVLSVTVIPTSAIMPATMFNELTSGWAHTCALTSANVVLCWGDGGSGQLGDGNKAPLVPTPVIMSGI